MSVLKSIVSFFFLRSASVCTVLGLVAVLATKSIFQKNAKFSEVLTYRKIGIIVKQL